MFDARSSGFQRKIDGLDADVTHWMARHGVTSLRISLGVIFFWFGALKLFPGLSPAEWLAGRSIELMTYGIVEPWLSVPVLGIGESLIGLGLLTGRALRVTLGVLLFHMLGTVSPLVLLPDVVFVQWPFVLTMEGQYIVKNLVLVSGAFVVAATVRGGRLKAEPTGEFRRLSGRFQAQRVATTIG